ncbi:hypothetical protein Tco_0566379 [Tanacetum coccineum]
MVVGKWRGLVVNDSGGFGGVSLVVVENGAVREYGCGDRVDLASIGVFLVFAGKCPPEKFSGGGEWWPAAGELAGEEGGEGEEI